MSGRVGNFAMLVPAFIELVRRRRDYDILWVVKFSLLGIAGIAAARLLGKGSVLVPECDGEMSGDHFFYLNSSRVCRTRLFKWVFGAGMSLRNWLLRQADYFVPISTEIEQEFLESGVPVHKIRPIPNGIDTDRFSPISDAARVLLRQRLSLPTETLLVCYCGRLVQGKGVEHLLLAWERLLRSPPRKHLVIVGSGENWFGGHEDTLRSFVQVHELTDSTTFTGYVPNTGSEKSVVDYLRASDVYVLPTERDALPTTVMEAMACELPVVASRVGGIVDMVSPRETGFLIEPRNVDSLAQALETLAADPELRRSMGRKGRRRIVADFSIDRVVSLYVDSFASIRARP